MLLTIATTHQPATDLGYLLHKHPERVQTFPFNGGQAHVFYPQATAERCTAALLLEVDPVGLARGRGQGTRARALEHYVNDRPYVASSFLSVAIGDVFGTALAGRCNARPELAETPLPLTARLSVLPCRGGEPFLRRLFEPLGYRVVAKQHPLDERFPEWGASRYFTVELSGTVRLSDLLTHLTVLVPVLDDAKHYYVGADEVEKLLRRGAGWLPSHPERDEITRRYLRRRGSLVRDALERLIAEERPEQASDDTDDAGEAAVEATISLNQQRLDAVLAALKESGTRRVLDLGCGEGRLLRLLLAERQFTDIVGMDVSHRVLDNAADRLRLDRLPEHQRERIRLIHGSLTYRDQRLAGFDAAAVVEVIEHLDPPRLAAFERIVFEHARPGTVAITTPNAEYNVRWESLPAGRFRHLDHRFEWTRTEFEGWAGQIGTRYGYSVRFAPIGPVDPEAGAPTQMAIFEQR